MNEIKYVINDIVVDSSVFNGFLDYLRKDDFSYTYIEQNSYSDYTQFSIICRPSVFEVYQIHLANEALFGAGLKDKNTKLDVL